MEQIVDRRNQISQFLQPYMESCFQKSCEIIQSQIESNYYEIWCELKNEILICLKNTDDMQKKQNKGGLQYLVFSILKYGMYLDSLEMRIDAFDDSFYLDEQEAASYYHPIFLRDRLVEDLNFLCKKVKENFIRLQNYEFLDIKREYADFYYAILFRMLESMAGVIVDTVMDSGVNVTADFKIIFGGYMEKGVVIYGR